MARSAQEIFADLNKTMLKPQQGLLTQVRNNYVPQPVDWASAVVPGTPGTRAQKALRTEIRNNQNKLTQAGVPLPSTKHDDPWYIDVLNFLDRGRSAIVNPMADVAEKGFGNADILGSIGKGLAGDERRQFQEVIDNTWMSNIPGINRKVDDLLSYTPIYRGAKELAKLASPQNVKQKEDILNSYSIGGFAGDVAFDPLTYITLGGSSALKAGQKAVQTTAKNVAKEAGLNLGNKTFKGGVNDVAKRIADSVFEQTLNKVKSNPNINPRLYEDLAMKKYHQTLDQILNAGKESRATAQNALVNLDVPFTNTTKQFGTKPEWLKLSDSVIGTTQVNKAKQFLDSMGVTDKQLPDMLKARYGKTSLDNFTIQEFDDLMANGLNLQQMPVRNMPSIKTTSIIEEFDAIPQFNNSRKMAEWLEPHLEKLGFPKADGWNAKTLHKILENDPSGRTKVLQDMINTVLTRGTPVGQRVVTKAVDGFEEMVDKALKTDSVTKSRDAGVFTKDMGGNSPLGKKLSNLASGIKPRTLGSQDDVVNSAAGKILDADNKVYGQSIQMRKDLESLKEAMRGLNENEKRAIDYILENKTPDGTTIANYVNESNMDKIMQIADKFRAVYKQLGEADLQAGTIPNLRENYTHHAVKGDETSLAEILSDPNVSKYLGRSSTNRAGLERKSFETMAELDDAIKTLENAMRQPGADVDAISRQVEKLQNLFHRDPLESLATRYQQSIKSRAYKELGESLENDGLIVKTGTGRPVPENELKKNYTKIGDLTKNQQRIIGQVGLKEAGDRVHNEVLRGLERVDNLFTDAGMNKLHKSIESALNTWKGLVTINVPSHHLFNMIGNVANATLAGVKPSAYRKAGEILKDGKGDIYQKALEHGVLNQGIASDLGLAFEKQARDLSLGERAVYNNPLAKGLNTVGNYGDNITRMAMFIHALEKTGSTKIASQQVRRYLFNYREMTKTDRAIRLVVPFWNWTKNNLPLQVMEFIKQPRYYNMFQELREMLNEEQPKEMMPEYARDDYWKVPGQEDTLFNLRLPFQELKGLSDIPHMLTSMQAPGIKIPSEVVLNKQFFNDMPIDSTRDKSLGGFLGYDMSKDGGIWEYGANQIGLPGRVIKNNVLPNDYSPGAIADTFLQSIFGKPIKVDREKQETSNLYRERDTLRNAVKRAERSGQIQ